MKTVALLSVLLAGSMGLVAQDQQAPLPPPPGQVMSPEQLNDLVAPIALYPDPLLSQVMVAATYPLEVVQAFQWLQKTPGLQGADLTSAAAEQNWDPSVQALVVFPDVLKRLNDDISWTTALGNSFLAQQQDVMDAVQRMRAQAQQAGKLQSTPQETVTTDNEDGRGYIEIEPANPDVIYVPVYDPAWIWGPPLYYPYARWYYPPRSVIYGGVGFGFGGGINIGLAFGGGWHGWGGWGWRPGWGTRTVIVNNSFIHQHNFNTRGLANAHGSSVWAHDVAHREGVPYATRQLNDRYRGSSYQQQRSFPQQQQGGQRFDNRGTQPQQQQQPQLRFDNRGAQPQQQQPQQQPQMNRGGERFGNRQMPASPPPSQNRSAFGGMENGRAAQTHAEHGYSSMGGARSAPAPRSAPEGGGGRPAGGRGGGRRN